MMRKILSLLIPIFFINVSAADSVILFEDDFDDSPDWQSNQTVHKSMPEGRDISWGMTYKAICQEGYCPPEGWTSYRAASSRWQDDRGRDTYLLNGDGARGEGGKGITYNVESTGDYGTWAGGSLDLWLGSQGYQELYVRMYIRFSSEWLYSAGTSHAMQKIIRISTFNEDIATTSHNPQAYGPTNSVNWPVWYPDWFYNYAFGYGYFTSSTRKAPDYDSSENTNHTDVRFPSAHGNDAQGDNRWHCYEFRVKMNSAPGVADGEWEFFFDGESVKKDTDVVWKKEGSNSIGWNWLMFLDNATIATYPEAMKREMALHMDDVVVSTEYIGPDYVIGETLPQSPSRLRIKKD